MNASEAKAKRDAMVRESGLSGREWYRKVYLHSDHWSELRSARLFAAGFQCEKCQKTGTLDVHHLRYRSIFNVTVDDLQALCRSCHNAEHEDKKDIRRYSKKAKPQKIPKKPRPPRPPKQPKEKREKQNHTQLPLSDELRKMMRKYRSIKKSTTGSREEKFLAAINAVEPSFELFTNPDVNERNWIQTMKKLKARMIKILKSRLRRQSKPQ
jgi:hypothetical protein